LSRVFIRNVTTLDIIYTVTKSDRLISAFRGFVSF